MDGIGGGGIDGGSGQRMDSGEERTQLSDSRQSTLNHNQGLNRGLTHNW